MSYGDAAVSLRRHAETRPGSAVRFSCRACGAGHDLPTAEAIWLLKALRLGDEESPVADAARLDDHACVRCGGRRWECWPAPG